MKRSFFAAAGAVAYERTEEGSLKGEPLWLLKFHFWRCWMPANAG